MSVAEEEEKREGMREAMRREDEGMRREDEE